MTPNLTTDKNGKLFNSVEEIVKTWETFLSDKFSTTPAENDTDPLREIPPERFPTDDLSRKEFELAVAKLSNDKVVGPDR